MTSSSSLPRVLRLIWAMLAITAALQWSALAATFVWLEGEQPTKVNIPTKLEGTGNPHFLSQSNWLKIGIESDKMEKDAPADGVLVEYNFKAPAAGDYEVWNRIGFEAVRSQFDWRMDGGDWKSVSPDELTTDLMELSFWTEVAWLKLGKQTLTAGDHTLVIRLPKTKDAKGKWQRILYASDALCLSVEEFAPYKFFKPGEDHQTDKDRDAAKQVFQFPDAAAAGSRVSLPLNGIWEVCRNDEQMPGEVAAPIKDMPSAPRWTAIAVPGDKNQRDDLVFAHRLWYRTRVNIPASQAGRSLFLVFPQNNLNTTVLVNGQYCGFDKNPFARVQIDISKAIKPGVNEVWVGIKDAWYGYSASPTNPLKLRKRWNLPKKYLGDGFQDLAYPIWNHPQSGILVTPEIVSAGAVYAADVFCQPSVAKKELSLDVTLKNPTAKEVAGELLCEAVNVKTGDVEKKFPAKAFTLGADKEETLKLTEPWSNAKLWWPDDPNLYKLRTTIKLAGKIADVQETTFGFREWGSKGKDFTLNGFAWHGWADCFTASSKDAWLKFYKEKNQTTMRFWGTSWQGMQPEQALSFYDEKGVVCRRSGILDGEAIGYNAIENDAELKKLYGSEVKMDLMKNWLDQMVAQVKGERNHPSVQIWSIENEWLFINCINLYGGLMDKFEAEVKIVSDAVRAADPTRLTMTDGGAANKDNSMPVHGNHYVWDSAITKYPDLAYDSFTNGGGRGRWTWDMQRPRFIGEDYFIAGNHPELSCIGGEAAFTGKAGTLPASGLMARILTEGYRWADCGAFHLWMGQGDTDGSLYPSFAGRAVFCRQWDWTFASAQSVSRTLGIFNDTHYDDPISFTWTLNVGGKKVTGATKEYRIGPGTNEKFDLAIAMPKVTARSEGELVLSLSVKGKEVYKDTKAVSVLPVAKPTSGANILVYDPEGSVTAFLKGIGQKFTAVTDLATLPDSGKILLIGKDALKEAESTSSKLAAWASSGRTVIVLEQKNPLKYQALPCEMESAVNEGRTAFGEDLDHPALAGLKQKDFFTWGPDSVVYRNAYVKPSRGAKSLIQCDQYLRNSALVEVPTGKGLMLLSQLCIGEKLAGNAVAQAVLSGLISYGSSYKQEFMPAAAAAKDDPQLAKTLSAIGLKYTDTADPMAALKAGKVAIVAATTANLKTLAANIAQVKQFTAGGGWIVLNGLTPEGLADFNQLVGVEHIIRPFRREKVTFPLVKNHLTAGLTSGDVALYSNERIFGFQEGNFISSDTFSYVVDYDEVAPFAKFPDDFALNIVNGMVSADAWKYIYNVPAPATPPLDLKLVFPKPQELIEMEWIGNTFYFPVTKVQLFFDGNAAGAASFDTKPNNEPQTFPINPAIKGTALTLRMADWEKIPGRNAVTGLDNIRLKAKRTPDFYAKVKPMLNVGALVEYPQGTGGIVLCNVRYKDTEEVPANGSKKQAMLATILRNLKAPFAGKSVIAGANLKYSPIDLSKQANAFRDEKGWFGDAKYTFKNLPTGKQTFAGVNYDIFEFATSPVPTVLILSDKASQPAKEILGIPVNRKADALFFLHTMRLDSGMNDDDRKKQRQFETLRYVVTYADGKQETVPVYAEVDIHDYKQKSPKAIPGAQLAWTAPYAGTEYSAAAYAKQWNNPRPDVEIKSIDMLPGAQPRGVPALIAITAATAE